LTVKVTVVSCDSVPARDVTTMFVMPAGVPVGVLGDIATHPAMMTPRSRTRAGTTFLGLRGGAPYPIIHSQAKARIALVILNRAKGWGIPGGRRSLDNGGIVPRAVVVIVMVVVTVLPFGVTFAGAKVTAVPPGSAVAGGAVAALNEI